MKSCNFEGKFDCMGYLIFSLMQRNFIANFDKFLQPLKNQTFNKDNSNRYQQHELKSSFFEIHQLLLALTVLHSIIFEIVHNFECKYRNYLETDVSALCNDFNVCLLWLFETNTSLILVNEGRKFVQQFQNCLSLVFICRKSWFQKTFILWKVALPFW